MSVVEQHLVCWRGEREESRVGGRAGLRACAPGAIGGGVCVIILMLLGV